MSRASRSLLHSFAILALASLAVAASPPTTSGAASPPPDCWQAGGASIPAGLPPDLTRALNAITPLAERARAESNVPGITIAVMLDGQVVYAGGFGCADLATGMSAMPDTIARAGSISKLFTATMLIQLRDAGRLDLDRPVRDYVPDVWFRSRDGREIAPTFRQLASHTSGLPRSIQPPPATPAKLFRRLHDVRAIGEPGQRVSYSNLGVAVLGQALAAITGQPFDQYVADQILAPLGMDTSSFDPATLPRDRLATGYGVVALFPDGTLQARAVPPASLATMAPAGGLYTTPLDLLRFAALQWGGVPNGDAVLSQASVREMRQPVAGAGGAANVGIGWFIRDLDGQTMIMHNGSVDGFRADLRVVPSLRLAVAVIYNQRPPASVAFLGPERLSTRVLMLLLPLLSANGARDRISGE